MAFQAGPISITFSFQDDDLAQSTVAVKLPETTPLAFAYAFATDFVALLSPVSDCALQRYSVNSGGVRRYLSRRRCRQRRGG